jgi:hypothetical protein
MEGPIATARIVPGRWLRAALVGLVALPAGAEVVRLEIGSREPFAGGRVFGATGAYEKLRGRLVYAVEPDHPANARIVDLGLAPRDPRGRVAFSGDFVLLKPTDLALGNRRLLYEVNNRGNLGILSRLNRGQGTNDPETTAHAGNGFLMRQGYSILWSAWNWDVRPGNGRLQIEIPVARGAAGPVSGRVVAEIVVGHPSEVEPFAWGDSRGYPVADPTTNGDARLSVRDGQGGQRVELPRGRWRFADETHLRLDGGFEPGRIYELVYTASDPRIVGLGLAAIRDAISFFRFEARDAAGTPNPLARAAPDGRLQPDPEKALVFGISQSGRVIQHMLFQGFHVDESGRLVFEGAMPHVGWAKGSFNHRFAQTTRHPSPLEDHQYPADFFPFGTMPDTDPVSGRSGDALAVPKAMGRLPFILYTGTSTEYWTRAASLLHTDPAGSRDAPIHERARVYFIAGGQHGISGGGERVFENLTNPLDHSPPLRALLVALDRWLTHGSAPPDSAHPRIDRGELVTVAAYRAGFPKPPGVRLPTANLQPPRLELGPRFESEGIVDRQPPAFGPAYVTLVPAPDEDGNDRGGIRLPEVAVPLGTYTGWNLRGAAMGAEDQLARWSGSYLPFPVTEAERERSGDPRRSLEARYAGQADYLRRVEAAAEDLRRRGFLLAEDVQAIVARARERPWPPAAP